MNWPPITRGLGKLTPERWDALGRAAMAHDSLPRPGYTDGIVMRLGIVGGSPTLIAGADYRWEYTLYAVSWDATSEDYTQGTATSGARNAWELPNTATTAAGVDVAALPDGWDILPVPEGTLVLCWSAGGRMWFTGPNPVDGACA